MKLAKITLSIMGAILMTAAFFSSMGCDEGVQMVDNVVTKPPEQTESTDPATDTTPPTVVRIRWYADSGLKQLLLNTITPGSTMYVKVVFSEPVEHIIENDASARPALSLVVNGQATRLHVLPHNAGNRAFVSGTCKPLPLGTRMAPQKVVVMISMDKTQFLADTLSRGMACCVAQSR